MTRGLSIKTSLARLARHAARSHGVDFRTNHYVPANGSIYRAHRLKNLDGLKHRGVFSSKFDWQSEAEQTMVDKSIHRVIGKAAQLLRPITAVEDDVAKRLDPLKER